MNLQDQYLSLRTLTVFAGIRKDAVITALESLLTADPEKQEEFVGCYCAFTAALYERDTDWSRYLYALVMEDDNICVRQAAVKQAENRNPQKQRIKKQYARAKRPLRMIFRLITRRTSKNSPARATGSLPDITLSVSRTDSSHRFSAPIRSALMN